MEYGECAFVSLSHLLRMAVLSQRAVDDATKAYELGDPRFCLQLQDTEHSLRDLQSLVAERGRTLQAAGSLLDDHSVPASCTLRIYSALRITFAAAREIAHNASVIQENRECAECAPPRWREAARFANSLVTLNAVALINKQRSAAALVLRSWHHPGWPCSHALPAGEPAMRQIDANAEPEECVALCLTEIADQAFEVARSIVRWLASEGCPDTTGESATSLRQVSAERWMPCTAMPSLITSNGNMGALGFAQGRFVGESGTT